MVDTTDNHDLNLYEQGDENWSHRDDLETLEKATPVRDAEANRNSYIPYEGATFVATDTGAVYDGNGSRWTKASRNFEGIKADRVNNVTVIEDGSIIQDTLIDAQPSDGAHRSVVRVRPADQITLEEVDVPSGVVLDVRGCELVPVGEYMLCQRGNTSVMAEGAVVHGWGYGGNIFSFNGFSDDVNEYPGVNNPAHLTGYPLVFAASTGQTVVHVDNTGYDAGMSNVYTEVACRNVEQVLHVEDDSEIGASPPNFVNNCQFKFVGGGGTNNERSIIHLEGGETMGHHIHAPAAFQVKGGSHLLEADNVLHCYMDGMWVDPWLTEKEAFAFTNFARANHVELNPQYMVDRTELYFDTNVLNTVKRQGGSMMVPLDLSTFRGINIGDVAIDDGTNTPSGYPERAIWIDTDGDETGDAWKITGSEKLVKM